MSKNKQAADEQTVKAEPSYVKELLENGTVILKAVTRDELAEMVNTIPADIKYGAGAVGFNHETSEFTLRIDIV
ncbi:MAG: hypothetical protein K6E67_10430 [Prevotella sp.]|nr:hypothetical protein [Prevotella sp.]